jgi:hypothetical protein
MKEFVFVLLLFLVFLVTVATPVFAGTGEDTAAPFSVSVCDTVMDSGTVSADMQEVAVPGYLITNQTPAFVTKAAFITMGHKGSFENYAKQANSTFMKIELQPCKQSVSKGDPLFLACSLFRPNGDGRFVAQTVFQYAPGCV